VFGSGIDLNSELVFAEECKEICSSQEHDDAGLRAPSLDLNEDPNVQLDILPVNIFPVHWEGEVALPFEFTVNDSYSLDLNLEVNPLSSYSDMEFHFDDFGFFETIGQNDQTFISDPK